MWNREEKNSKENASVRNTLNLYIQYKNGDGDDYYDISGITPEEIDEAMRNPQRNLLVFKDDEDAMIYLDTKEIRSLKCWIGEEEE